MHSRNSKKFRMAADCLQEEHRTETLKEITGSFQNFKPKSNRKLKHFRHGDGVI